MTGRAVPIVLVAMLAVAPSAASACAASAQAAFETFIAAFNALDWATFRNCLADDVSLFNPDIPGAVSLRRLDGRAEVERSFRAVFDASGAGGPAPRGPGIHPDRVSLKEFGEAALVTFEFRRSDASLGRRSVLLTRTGTTWRIAHIHASNVEARP